MSDRIDTTSTIAAFSLESLEQMATFQTFDIARVDYVALVSFPREPSSAEEGVGEPGRANSLSFDDQISLDAREGRLARFGEEALRELRSGDVEDL